MKSQNASLNNPKFMFIILGAIIVIGLGIILLVNKPGVPKAALSEGSNYSIENIGPGQYKITDDTGNVVDFERVSSDKVIFKDDNGKRYEFVSGSPYRFIGMD